MMHIQQALLLQLQNSGSCKLLGDRPKPKFSLRFVCHTVFQIRYAIALTDQNLASLSNQHRSHKEASFPMGLQIGRHLTGNWTVCLACFH